jgi:hypothetical protein
MRQHKQPCNQCPFRKVAPPGWLGGMAPQAFLELAQSEWKMPCHKAMQREGMSYAESVEPLAKELAQCAGRAIFWRNQIKTPRTPDILTLPKSDAVFQWPKDFRAHHSKGPLVEADIEPESELTGRYG